MEKGINTKLISRWEKDQFEQDLAQALQVIATEDLIDIKLSTAIASTKVNYSALVIYKGEKL